MKSILELFADLEDLLEARYGKLSPRLKGKLERIYARLQQERRAS
jgi:hypothetical protein